MSFFYCDLEPGNANLDVLSLVEELRRRHNIQLFALSGQRDEGNVRYYRIQPFPMCIVSILGLARTVKKLRADVIVSDSAFFISIPAYILSRFLKVPLVIYCREIFLEAKIRWKPLQMPLRFIRNLVIRNSESVVAIDEGLRQYFQSETNREVHLVPASIDVEGLKLEDVRNKLNLPPNNVLILYLGNLSKYRRLDLLVESFAKVKTDDLKLVLGGRVTKGNAEYLKDLICKNGLEKSVVLLPYLPYSDVLSLIYSCDICVDPYPRRGVEEFQMGLKTIEYMAIGKPVLAIDVTGNRLIISDGQNGLLAHPDVNEFSKKLLQLIGDPQLRIRLGQSARQTMIERHNAAKVGLYFESLLTDVAEHSF